MIKRVVFTMLLIVAAGFVYAAELVVLTDGQSFLGTIERMDLAAVHMATETGEQRSFAYEDVLSIRRLGSNQDLVGVSWSTVDYDTIHYSAGINENFKYVPPRYTYRGISYNMETSFGMGSQLYEFFLMLREHHPDMGKEVISLIENLEDKLIMQQRRFTVGTLMNLVGVGMLLLPINFDDPAATPLAGKIVAISGFGVELVGLGVMISSLFVDVRDDLELIAESYNNWLVARNN
ncbi:MAG: hypothetical protein CVV52_10705 [Spirochaetae bacterium HGW-Spirochaetae-8]|jgi:hypothetical protein|nr:MAG: hypothetical protein CVV52_10705 [Spirochaetae bacterium HGW-Spirochaetae-8]